MNAYDDWDDWKSGKISSWDYAKSIGLGAATGALSTVGGAGVIGIASSAVASGVNEAGKQYIKQGGISDWSKVGRQAGYGAVGGGVGRSVSKAGGNIILQRKPVIGRKLGETGIGRTIKDAGDLGGLAGDATGSSVAGQAEVRFDAKK